MCMPNSKRFAFFLSFFLLFTSSTRDQMSANYHRSPPSIHQKYLDINREEEKKKKET